MLPDDDEHYVFNSHLVAYRCSDDPSQVKNHMMSDLLGTSRDQRATRDLDEGGIRQLGQLIVDALRKAEAGVSSGTSRSIQMRSRGQSMASLRSVRLHLFRAQFWIPNCSSSEMSQRRSACFASEGRLVMRRLGPGLQLRS